MYFIRTEDSVEDAKESLIRGRSTNSWAWVGMSPRDWLAFGASAEIFSQYDGAGDEAIIDLMGLEPCADGVGYWRPLPGLCALGSYVMDVSNEEWLTSIDRAVELFGGGLSIYAIYEGDFVGYDENSSDTADWELYTPIRLVRTFENPAKVHRIRYIAGK